MTTKFDGLQSSLSECNNYKRNQGNEYWALFSVVQSAVHRSKNHMSYMSAPSSDLGALGRPVQQSGIPYHFRLLTC